MRRSSFLIGAVTLGLGALTASAQQGPITAQLKAAFSVPEFQRTVEKFNTKLNFANAVGTADIALVPAEERWDARLRDKQSAILGGLYLAKDSQALRVGSGAYLVQASPSAGGATWALIDVNGNRKSVGLTVDVRDNVPGEDISVPIARLESVGARRRCCYRVDHIEHCGECN